MNQVSAARKHSITALMRRVALREGVDSAHIMKGVAQGTIVIPHNARRKISRPCAIGAGLRTKVNANIGTSPDCADLGVELRKLAVALDAQADTVMDLSIGADLKQIRRAILANSTVPVGTVPMYEIAHNASRASGDVLGFTPDDCLAVLEQQAQEGVDFFTIHAGVTRRSLKALIAQPRVMGIVSRGGAILARWMKQTGQENPFFLHFDKVLDICSRHDVTISLGDGLRPGSILDATDRAQCAELKILGELTLRARARSVQVMVEGPGHVPLDQVARNIRLEKKYCHNAPFYVLGPLVTDVAAGYDHISSAIGGALAASAGADFLCYVTPSEHVRLPSIDDVREGVIASRIAAHAADIVKDAPLARAWDARMSRARKARDWDAQIDLSIDPSRTRALRESSRPRSGDVCTMCGDYCSIKVSEALRE